MWTKAVDCSLLSVDLKNNTMFAKEIFASRRAALLKSGLKGIAFFPANDDSGRCYLDS